MMRYLIFLSVLLSFSYALVAQQTPVFSDYNFNAIVINPAHTGLSESTEVAFTNRGMINGFEGTPEYLSLSASVPFDYAGLGVGILRDKIGVTTATQFFASYAYKIYMGYDTNVPRWHSQSPNVLSFGLSGGSIQYSEDLIALDIDNDINFAENINTTIPTIGAGVLYNSGSYYIGLSAPNIVGDLLSSEKNVELDVPYYAYGGYKFFLGRTQEVFLKPNVLFKYVQGAPFQADLNLFANYKNKLEAGMGYRTGDLVNMLVGFYLFDNIRVNYTYNLALRDSVLGDSQGFSLTYRSGKGFGNGR